MKTKQVTEQTGLTKDTLRFYEKEQLIPAPSRDLNGYRIYDEEIIDQLKMITMAKNLGFTLNEIKELSQLLYAKHLTPTVMVSKLKNKGEEIEQKITELKKIMQLIDNALAGMCEYKEKLKENQ